MLKKFPILFAVFLSLFSFSLWSEEPLDGRIVSKVQISLENADKNASFDTKSLASRLKTQEKHHFSQVDFDNDLKMLAKEFAKIEPSVIVENEELLISIKLWAKPVIRSIHWTGNKTMKTKTLQKELGVKPNRILDRDAFTQALNKVKEYYLKKGYFESSLAYTTEPVAGKNEVDVEIQVNEGRLGHITKIQFKEFTKEEEKAIRELIHTKTYNRLLSWFNGNGIFREEVVDQDEMVILNYLQNKGYADAKVTVKIGESKQGVLLEWVLTRGLIYHFGKITFEGNTILSDEQIRKCFLIHSEEIYSSDKLRETAQAIKDAYGQKGYIETEANYTLKLNSERPIYDVDFTIVEGGAFKIGFIHIFGNTQTQSHVILRESLLVPGEVFNTKKLKATQERLQNIGYFKNVNVYAVKAPEDTSLGPNYRDVHIEVEETSTGNASLFLGFSSLEDLFGGLDISERNFNYKGFGTLFTKGPSSLRGGGEFAHAKFTIGIKQQNYILSWMTPYFRDSLWRVGFEGSATESTLTSTDYIIRTYGLTLFAAYPLTPYWTYGNKYRIRNSTVSVKHKEHKSPAEIHKEKEAEGVISAIGTSLSYDSTDNPRKAHRGLRFSVDCEVAGVGGSRAFFKVGTVNTYYLPLWSKGTMKYRADFRFIEPFGGRTTKFKVPLSERFFLGGEGTVRGYRPYILGPRFADKDHDKDDPTGGISSGLLSIEYSQEIFRFLDIFAFADAGSVSMKHFQFHRFNASYGVGVRLEIMNQMPITLGYGVPVNPDRHDDVQKFFFSMGGQF
jgi:outer membrane protein insertion porin family